MIAVVSLGAVILVGHLHILDGSYDNENEASICRCG